MNNYSNNPVNNINWYYPRICEVLWKNGDISIFHTLTNETINEAFIRLGFNSDNYIAMHVC